MERLALLEMERQRWVSHHMVKGLLRLAIYQRPDDTDLLIEDEEIMSMLFPWKKRAKVSIVRGADLGDASILDWIKKNAGV